MSELWVLLLASAAFVGTHFLLSHPLRAGMVEALGEKGFAGLYSLVSLILLGWMIWAYPAASESAPLPLWDAGTAGYVIATLLMWLGSVLFVGSLRRNPAPPRPGKQLTRIDPPRGVYSITRHPMMWGFALWGIVHAIVDPTEASLILTGAIVLLALLGAHFQDGKKDRLMGDVWRDYRARTSFLPFARGAGPIDAFALIGGTLLWLVATWAHGALGYRPAGIWAFFG